MFGSQFLVCPKISPPTQEQIDYHTATNVTCYLPDGVNWYYYWSGQPIMGQNVTQTIPVGDIEQGVFIREGSVIPLLNYQLGRMSLLEAINDPINLLVYPDMTTRQAVGDLYLDDGQTNNYQQNVRTQVQFQWNNNTMSIVKTIDDSNHYNLASGKFINKAQIFNVVEKPVAVINRYWSDMQNQSTVYMTMFHNAEEQSLTLTEFLIPVDQILVYGQPVTLFEIIWE